MSDLHACHLCRVQLSCTSEDSTWTTPLWSTTLGSSCEYTRVWGRKWVFILSEWLKAKCCVNCVRTFLLQADLRIPVLQSGRVQRFQHPVCGQPSAGDPGRAGNGSGTDPGVRAAPHPTTQLPPGGPHPLPTNGGPAYWPQGRAAPAAIVTLALVIQFVLYQQMISFS